MMKTTRNLYTIGFLIPLSTALMLWSCGEAPNVVDEQRGSIEVRGYLPNNELADSVIISLDGDSLGMFLNPHVAENILAGIHQLEVKSRQVFNPDSIVLYYSTPMEVTVQNGATVLQEFNLVADIPVSPYAGYMAPYFELYDLDTNLVTLTDLTNADNVALLYFFHSS